MIGWSSHARVLLFAAPADMRKGFDGLFGLVVVAGEDPFSGAMFLFISKRRDRAKVLTFDKGGFVLWYKRLERGCFRHPSTDECKMELDHVSLTMLLDGIDVSAVKRPIHWKPTKIPSRGGSTSERKYDLQDL